MNEDMPWVNLTQEEVEELRNKKYELTEYGKDKIRELMRNQEPYPDAMFEEAERREAANRELQKEEWERKQKTDRILERYNQFYNTEVSGLSWGTPITPEFQQAMTLECMLDALRYENLSHEFDVISTADINALIDGLYQQGKDYIKRVQEFKDSADGVA